MDKRNIIICTIKSWNIENARAFADSNRDDINTTIITQKEDLTPEAMEGLQPEFIFFPHWSYHVPADIYRNYECVAFHTGDLPYGRGGSPLQNLIARGHRETVICGLRMEEEFDAGPVYVREPISLDGTCDEIFRRSSRIIFDRMIPAVLAGAKPLPQEGNVVVFPRRKPSDGLITPDMSMEKIYDYIRMLDGEGYPPAFMEFGDYVMEFTGAEPDNDAQTLSARVVFRRKPE